MTSPVVRYCGETLGITKTLASPAELEPVCDVATGLLTKTGDEKPDTAVGT